MSKPTRDRTTRTLNTAEALAVTAAEDLLLDVPTNAHTIINAVPIPTILYGLDGKVRLWNPAAERVLGWKATDVVGIYPPHIHDLDSSAIETLIHEIASGEAIELRAVERLRSDGNRLSMRVSAAPVIDTQGEVHAVVAMLLDDTELLASVVARDQMEAAFETVFRQAPVPMWEEDYSEVIARTRALGVPESDLAGYLTEHAEIVQDLLGRLHIRDLNEAVLAASGGTHSQWQGGIPAPTLTADGLRASGEIIAALARGEPVVEAEFDALTMDGELHRMILRLAVAQERGDFDLSRVFVVGIDVTEMRKAQAKLLLQASILE